MSAEEIAELLEEEKTLIGDILEIIATKPRANDEEVARMLLNRY